MKNINIFLSENFHFLVVKFSVYLNRHVFVMGRLKREDDHVIQHCARFPAESAVDRHLKD